MIKNPDGISLPSWEN